MLNLEAILVRVGWYASAPVMPSSSVIANLAWEIALSIVAATHVSTPSGIVIHELALYE